MTTSIDLSQYAFTMEPELTTIRLPAGVWRYDPTDPLGPEGGFGAVFAGFGDNDAEVAVKRLHLEAGEAAHREIDIAKELCSRDLKHVLPVLDAGRDADSDQYFVIMPRAEKSLQDELDIPRTWNGADAAGILLEIVDGLGEVPDLVHRDLKPGNILWHDTKWKIADFGIARFVEAATSARTLKRCLSPQYAAPEQWKDERSTTATDIYALGCIGHALLTGRPPFDGPAAEDFKKQHLTYSPTFPDDVHPRLRSLLMSTLRKTGETRPTLKRVAAVLQRIREEPADAPGGEGQNNLAAAGAMLATRLAEEEASERKRQAAWDARCRVAGEARDLLKPMAVDLFDRVQATVESVERVDQNPGGHVTVATQAELSIWRNATSRVLEAPKVSSMWDIIIGVDISVIQFEPEMRRSANLVYAQLPGGMGYRWYEVAFEMNPAMHSWRDVRTHALNLTPDLVSVILPGTHEFQIAEGPVPIDGEDADAFYDRWLHRLALAIEGNL